MNINFKTLVPHLIALVIMLLLNIIYFSPQFQGKVIQQGDIVQVSSMNKEIRDYTEKNKRTTLWTNSMFGGMPGYTITMPTTANKIRYVHKALTLGIPAPAGWFFAGMLLFYLSMVLLGMNSWVSLIGAVMFGFSTNNLVLFEAGHTSKILTIFASAPIIAGLILTYRKKWLLGGALFTLGLALNVQGNHVQMSYYLGIALIILVLVYLISALRKGDFASFIKSSAILLVGTILAVGSHAVNLWTTYEYSKDTMRGKPILEAKANVEKSSSNVEGLDYEYAMRWSNGLIDVLAGIVPKIAGGASGEYVDGKTEIGKAIGARKKVQVPLYFGSLPFTSGPVYFGIVAVFLFLLGAFIVPGRFKWWLVLAVIVTTLLTMGKNLGALNELIYNNLPLYNKFRTPNSIGSITAIFIPILAVLALNMIVKEEDKGRFIKPLLYTIAGLGGLTLLIAVLGPSFTEFSSPNDEKYKQIIEPLLSTRESVMRSSAFKSLFYVLLIGGVIYFYLKNKLNSTVMLSVVGLLGTFDLIDVGNDYLDKSSFISKKNYDKNFEPRPVDLQILEDKDLSYRVYDATIDTYNDASASYFHKTIGGYSPAKLQRIQDMIDNHISKGNQKVLDMMNTRYFIVPGQGDKPMVQKNPGALGNGWFVQNVKVVDNANAEIDSLTNFNPRSTAVIHKEFQSYVDGISSADSSSSVKLISYSPDLLEYDVVSSKDNQLAIFSEMWYGPNKGWQAYIDGKPVDHIRANYILRALKIPSGNHKVKFEFKPNSFYTGEKISLVSSLIIILGLLALIARSLFKFKNQNAAA